MIDNPKLSVVVPTCGRPKELQNLVNQLLQQTVANFELIIVDQSPEPTPPPVHDPRIRHHRMAQCGPIKGLNEGVKLARGDLLIFLNDDVELHSENFLLYHSLCYLSDNVIAVGGRIVDKAWQPNARYTCCRINLGGRTIHNLTGREGCILDSVHGANMSFRREIFDQIGLFDEGYNGTGLLAETDFATRLHAIPGKVIIFCPEASLTHLSAPSGGVRCNPLTTERSRFHNSGRYIMKHRGVLGLAPFIATFSAIALAKAMKWRQPMAALALLLAMVEGAWETVQ